MSRPHLKDADDDLKTSLLVQSVYEKVSGGEEGKCKGKLERIWKPITHLKNCMDQF